MNLFQVFLVLLSALLIAVADIAVKHASAQATFVSVLGKPLFWLACVFYLLQVLIAVYLFLWKAELSIYAILYIIFYSILCVLAGVILFHEPMSAMKFAGIIFALIGAVLLSV